MAFLLCSLKNSIIYAQSEFQPDSVRTAKINSPVPYFKLLGVEDQNLLLFEPSDFCGKIGIIDFWSSKSKTSSSVIGHYETLAKLFGDKIKIILVSNEPLEDIQKFAKQNPSPLSFAIDSENNMNYLFPHTTSPHAVVVNTGGDVKAITYPQEITVSAILSLLKNEDVGLKLKSELMPNQDVLFANTKAGEPVFKSNITAYDPEKKINYEWLAENEFVFTNFAIASVYQSLYNFTPVRTRIESKKSHWYKTNRNSFICFEMKMPHISKSELKKEAITLLNKALPIKSKMEFRTQNGYALVQRSDIDSTSKSKLIGEQLKINGFTVRTLREFIQLIELYELVDAPIFNGTDMSIETPISIESLPRTPAELNNALKKYGLTLVEKQFTTDFLILYDETEDVISSSNK